MSENLAKTHDVVMFALQSCATRSRVSLEASVNMKVISSLAASATLPVMLSGNSY